MDARLFENFNIRKVCIFILGLVNCTDEKKKYQIKDHILSELRALIFYCVISGVDKNILYIIISNAILITEKNILSIKVT